MKCLKFLDIKILKGVFFLEHINKPLLYILLFIAVLAISTTAVIVELTKAPAPIIATYRLFFTALLFLPLLLFNKSALEEMLSLTTKQWLFGLLSGFFLAAHYLLWFESLRFTSVASSTVLVNLQPLFAFIGGYFLYGERLRGLAIAGGILSVLGSFVIGWADFQISGSAFFGDILALLGAATFTIYFFIGHSLRKSLSLIPYAFIGYATSSFFLFGYCLILQYPLTGYSSTDWFWFFFLALIPTFLGHSILNYMIKWLSTSMISMSIIMEPIFTMTLACFILGETVTRHQIIGSGIIFIGVFLFLAFNKPVQLEKNRSKSPIETKR